MALSMFGFLALNIDDLCAGFEGADTPSITREECRHLRDMVVTHDPAACNSKYGALALMAMFPRTMN